MHIVKRGGRYYYNRRVPAEISSYDNREHIRLALKTDSYEEAKKKATLYDEQIEDYWKTLLETGKSHSNDYFKNVVSLARKLGFNYKTNTEIAKGSIPEILSRMKEVEPRIKNSHDVSAIAGTVKPPNYMLSHVLEDFWRITKDRIINKSENQVRKWKNPRIKAHKNLMNTVGDKPLKELSRNDLIAFRDWWMQEIKKRGLKIGSANKELHIVRNVIETVNEHEQIGLNISWIFNKTTFRERPEKTSRMSYETDYIKNELLDPKNLAKLNDEARAIFCILAETGARPSEICRLEEEDIILDHAIPHIKIQFKQGQDLKTSYSERTIPLIGHALEETRKFPKGFGKYRDSTDNFSATINKHLKSNGLRPTKNHTLYSLRHSFQDRMLAVYMPERIQCSIFGHKYPRPEYGSGASLGQKLEWISKIQINIG